MNSPLFDASTDLRRPFTAEAVGWRIDEERRDHAVCFVDRGLVIDRLNLVVPDLWSDRYNDMGDGKTTACEITIGEQTRGDVGEGRTMKARRSDALKRAAAKFGVGTYLARVPSVKLGPTHFDHLGLNNRGLGHCRRFYQRWLDTRGIELFGAPLDQGDTEMRSRRMTLDDGTDRTDGVDQKRPTLPDHIASFLESAPAEGLDLDAVARGVRITPAIANLELHALARARCAVQLENGRWGPPEVTIGV